VGHDRGVQLERRTNDEDRDLTRSGRGARIAAEQTLVEVDERSGSSRPYRGARERCGR
jgi:hypothetical protein